MSDASAVYVVWALTLGVISAVSLPLGSLVGLNVRFGQRYIAILTAFGAGALILREVHREDGRRGRARGRGRAGGVERGGET